MSGKIEIQNIIKDFGKTKVLKDISLDIAAGSFTILLGPSGCGKTTLLRIIAGLEKPGSGNVAIDGERITDYEPKDRRVAMVFQNYALYPHMSVFKNVEYGLRVKKVARAERERMVNEVLAQVELSDQAAKLPAQLSGGQRQRVALARAIVKRPKAFLMDEPLSNLDAKLRTQMRLELIDMYQKLDTTFLYVTHDQIEAMSMGTDIVVMNEGEIMQQGSPEEIYENPANLFVAQFVGSPPTNIVPWGDRFIGIRPENIALTAEKAERSIPARIRSAEQLGGETIYHLETALGRLNVKAPSNWRWSAPETFAAFAPDKIMFFGKDGQRIGGQEGLLEDCIRFIDERA